MLCPVFPFSQPLLSSLSVFLWGSRTGNICSLKISPSKTGLVKSHPWLSRLLASWAPAALKRNRIWPCRPHPHDRPPRQSPCHTPSMPRFAQWPLWHGAGHLWHLWCTGCWGRGVNWESHQRKGPYLRTTSQVLCSQSLRKETDFLLFKVASETWSAKSKRRKLENVSHNWRSQ